MKALFSLLFLFLIHLTFAQSIDEIIEREISYHHFSGIIRVISEDGTIIEKHSNQFSENQVEASELPFDIGSISKQFTAALILDLVNQKKLQLHGPINEYLGPYASEKWQKVTVHHLLTHSGGIPSLFQSGHGLPLVLPAEEPVSADSLISVFHDVSLTSKPGREYRYSNSGYFLLALIIEQKSAKPYAEVLSDFLAPYELKNTSFGHPSSDFARPTFGYRKDLLSEAPLLHSSWMLGAGGIFSTLDDLDKWTDLITSEEFLTKELRELFIQPQFQVRPGRHYAYGLEIIKGEQETIQHDGTNFGYAAYLGFRRATGEKIIILTNSTFESMTLIGRSGTYINDLVNRLWESLDQREVALSPAIEKFDIPFGTYVFEDGLRLQIGEGSNGMVRLRTDYYPLTRVAIKNPIDPSENIKNKALFKTAEAIHTMKFRKMKSVSDFQIKALISTGVFRWGFGQVTADKGETLETIPYSVSENTGKIRLIGTEETIDFIVYFNEEKEVQGVFEHGYFEDFKKKELLAYPVEGKAIFVDGFPYGELGGMITFEGRNLIYTQAGRKFQAVRESSLE